MLWTVLSTAGRGIVFFFTMLLILLVSFVIFAEQMFGPTIDGFQDILKSTTTLMTMLLGVVDIYWEMLRSAQNPTVAMIFFFVYILFMFFIM